MPRPRRPKLAQHFLADTRFRRRIVDALDIRPDELVIEIGAGRGAMTGLLAERAGRVVAIELDASLAAEIKENFRSDPRIEIVRADILSTDLAELCRRSETKKCFVFGNLPYYITAPILIRLRTFWTWVRSMALLVQREVAERITARPGTRHYGALSVLMQLNFEPRILLNVPPGAFSPPPSVHSALIYFKMRPKFPEWGPADHEKFLDFVKHCFEQKRKTLLNNLAGIYSRRVVLGELDRLALPSNIRAEQLKIEQMASLFRNLQ